MKSLKEMIKRRRELNRMDKDLEFVIATIIGCILAVCILAVLLFLYNYYPFIVKDIVVMIIILFLFFILVKILVSMDVPEPIIIILMIIPIAGITYLIGTYILKLLIFYML